MSWNFFVRHYIDDAQEARNSKATYTTPSGETYIGLDPPVGSKLKGILYPRAGTLGGCTAHNALITVYPHEEDWATIQTITGDDSWAPTTMRRYFKRVEANHYLSPNSTAAIGHGFNGWLGTSEIDLKLVARDPKMMSMIAAASAVFTGHLSPNISDVADLQRLFAVDINTDMYDRDRTEGIYAVPIAVTNGRRSSPRDFLVATANTLNTDGSKKYKLDIRLNALATKVRFSAEPHKQRRAVGVEFLDGKSLYSADSRSATASPGRPGSVNAKKEVIISAGTFNTPQILKLSGIGPKAELKAFNITVLADLPGVGANLQDHYEISTVIESDTDFEFLQNCTFLNPNTTDACFAEYNSNSTNRGPYASNITPVTVVLKSQVAENNRDIYMFGAPGDFRGYWEGYSDFVVKDKRHWTWSILKAHEKNHAGSVNLRSADPLDMPFINIAYFDSGNTGFDAVHLDIEPLVEGMRFSRRVYGNISALYQGSFVEVYPGANVTTTDEIESFIKDEGWGHHVTGTARMGNEKDPYAVIDSRLRVRGVSGLRVVDASIFAEIPGFFPAVAIYMISEKAADMILEDNC
jgi:choline dehydrogenase